MFRRVPVRFDHRSTRTVAPSPPLCVVVGLGRGGRAVIERAKSFPRATPVVLLPDSGTDDEWRAAVRSVLRPPTDAPPPADTGRVGVVLVGRPDELAGGAPAIDRARIICNADEATAVTLELPGADLPQAYPLSGRFRLSARYAAAALSSQECLDLAARLLAAGGAEALLIEAARRPGKSFTTGVAAAWLPDGSVRQSLAGFVLAELASELCPPTGQLRPTLPQLQLVPGIPLTPRLAGLLAHEAKGWLRRFDTGGRDRPFPGPNEVEAHSREVIKRAIAAWVADVSAAVCSTLTRGLEAPGEFPARLASLRQAMEQVEAEGKGRIERENKLAEECRSVLAQLREADACRRYVGGWFLWKTVRRRRATRLVRAHLRRYLAIRTRRLMAGCERSALTALASGMKAVAGRLESLAAGATGVREGFARLLRPPYPNLVAMQDAGTLEALLRELGESLDRVSGRRAADEVWRRALPRLVTAGAEDPWRILGREATAVAAGCPDASRRFSDACRGLMPARRPTELVRLVIDRAALRFLHGVNRFETRLALSAVGDSLPVIVRLQWGSRVDS